MQGVEDGANPSSFEPTSGRVSLAEEWNIPVTRYMVADPAERDAAAFSLDDSVRRWRQFAEGEKTFPALRPGGAMEWIQGLAQRAVSLDPMTAAYWTYHWARTGFFMSQAFFGLVAHQLYEDSSGQSGDPVKTPLQTLSSRATEEAQWRLAEAYQTYQEDLANIQAGRYLMPWDMTTMTHRQYNPLYIMQRSAMFVGEAVSTLRRRVRSTSVGPWLKSPMYPEYYLNDFHYQTDGWLSKRSADVYEYSTEVLFLGRQDAMQRISLVALSDYLQGKVPEEIRLLEVACGTGRFHTHIKDNYPAMPTVASDLSPYYLANARDNVRYWKRLRAPGLNMGGEDGSGTEFVQAPAENLGLEDESFDVVLSIYLHHELPEAAREAVAREAYRVLKPGGMFILTDSAQMGDRPDWRGTMGNFGNFNEPHYRNYILCDLAALHADVGFLPGKKYMSSATKTLTFIKGGV